MIKQAALMLCASTLGFTMTGLPNKAHAILRATADQDVDNAHTRTDTGVLTGPQEVKVIDNIWKQYYAEHPPRPAGAFNFIGQVEINNIFPVTTFLPGVSATLSFEFIDASTLLPVSGAGIPTIGSVLYEVKNIDPANPLMYTVVGTSADSSTNFAIPYTFGANEPTFLGIPFDTSGSPIVELDFDGAGNVAEGEAFNIPIPEPGSVSLLGLTILALGLLRRARISGP